MKKEIQKINFNNEGLASARDIYKQLGYSRWEDFDKLLSKVEINNSGSFGLTRSYKTVPKGNHGATQEVKDYVLTQEQLFKILQASDKAKAKEFIKKFSDLGYNVLQNKDSLKEKTKITEEQILLAKKRRELSDLVKSFKYFKYKFNLGFGETFNALYLAFFGYKKEDLEAYYNLGSTKDLFSFLNVEVILFFDKFIQLALKKFKTLDRKENFIEKLISFGKNFKEFNDFSPLSYSLENRNINRILKITENGIKVNRQFQIETKNDN